MKVVDLTDEYFRFVSLCTHIDDPNEERDSIVSIRESWLREAMAKGLIVKVAVDEKGKPVGFAHCLPIELGTWGMSGKDLMTVPCLTRCYKHVYNCEHGSGIGRALMEAVEAEAKNNKKGVAVLAYIHDFWFMHYAFFKKLGYEQGARHADAVIMLKSFEPVDPPVMHKSKYSFRPVPGKIVVDAFWNPICLTSILEMKRVREVCAQYADTVILNEYNTWNKNILNKYQISRALFINGQYRCWGYAAPQDELKKEIDKTLEKITEQGV